MLGAATMRRLHLHLGSPLRASVQGAPPKTVSVVGSGVIPPLGASGRFGEGAFVRYSALKGLCNCDAPPPDVAFLRFIPGADREREAKRIAGLLRKIETPEAPFQVSSPDDPKDLLNFGRVRNMPLILAGLIALLATATLAHVLVSGITRRRRDLAILKTIGFVRGQVRRTVAWQATTLAVVALAIGVPFGIAAGRWLWTTFATNLGVFPEPRIPAIAVALVVPGTIVLANLVALLPARSAARTQPASILRTE